MQAFFALMCFYSFINLSRLHINLPTSMLKDVCLRLALTLTLNIRIIDLPTSKTITLTLHLFRIVDCLKHNKFRRAKWVSFFNQ
jgi:hypothetical protein